MLSHLRDGRGGAVVEVEHAVGGERGGHGNLASSEVGVVVQSLSQGHSCNHIPSATIHQIISMI